MTGRPGYWTMVNKLKTTPTPNKNGSYGIKRGGFVCHKSRTSYAIKVGLFTTFSVKIPLFQEMFTPYDPHFMAYVGVIFFCQYGGGGGQNYFQMGMNGGSSAQHLACTPCVPLFSTLFTKGGSRGAFRLPGAGRDHFHCTVEPSPGHIRCRLAFTSVPVKVRDGETRIKMKFAVLRRGALRAEGKIGRKHCFSWETP